MDTKISHLASGEILVNILQNEKSYKKAKIFKSLEIYLQKGDAIFPLKNASSGELSLISTAVFIASTIEQCDGPVVVLIDEPENSLHPDWQCRYIRNLKDLFPYYDIEFHIATHSPMLIAGAVNEEGVTVLRHDNNDFMPIRSDIKNIEDAYIDQFGIVTPENNALSERCIDIINNVEWGDLSKQEACKQLTEFKEKSFDIRQQEFLNGVLRILDKLKVING